MRARVTKKVFDAIMSVQVSLLLIGLIFLAPLMTSPIVFFFKSDLKNGELHLATFYVCLLILLFSIYSFSISKIQFMKKLATILSATAYALAFTFFHIDPIINSSYIGAPTFYIATSLVVYLIICWLYLISRFLVSVAGVILVAAFLFKPVTYDVREIEGEVPNINLAGYGTECDHPVARCYFTAWLVSRSDIQYYSDLNVPYPVYLVSASGGGIYAAAHAYEFLSGMSMICPTFRNHVFAISSVSGGSFGAAVFASENKPQHGAAGTCALPRDSDVAGHRMAGDFLSPTAGAFAFGNIPNFVTPMNLDLQDSGSILTKAFSASLQLEKFDEPQAFFWTPEGNSPAVFFNVTNSASGNVEVISPFPIALELSGSHSHVAAPFANLSAMIPMSEAASLSARFPIITPPGIYRRNGDSQLRTPSVLVDGGYADNSGSSTARLIWKGIEETSGYDLCEDENEFELKSYCGFRIQPISCKHMYAPNSEEDDSCTEKLWENKRIPITLNVIQIRIEDSGEIEQFERGTPFSEGNLNAYVATASEPIWAILNARSARASISRSLMQYEMFGELYCSTCGFTLHDTHYYESVLNNKLLNIPLTWSIGGVKYTEIVDYIGGRFACRSNSSECKDEVQRMNEIALYKISTQIAADHSSLAE